MQNSDDSYQPPSEAGDATPPSTTTPGDLITPAKRANGYRDNKLQTRLMTALKACALPTDRCTVVNLKHYDCSLDIAHVLALGTKSEIVSIGLITLN